MLPGMAMGVTGSAKINKKLLFIKNIIKLHAVIVITGIQRDR